EPVHEHTLTDLEGRDHGRARDAERLDEELLDAEGEPDRHTDDHEELDDRTRRALLTLALALLQRCHGGATRLGAASGAARLGVAGVSVCLGLGVGRNALRLGGISALARLRSVRALGGVRTLGALLRLGHRYLRLRDRHALGVGRAALLGRVEWPAGRQSGFARTGSGELPLAH